MGKDYGKLPSELVAWVRVTESDKRRFDSAVTLYAKASESAQQWQEEQKRKQ